MIKRCNPFWRLIAARFTRVAALVIVTAAAASLWGVASSAAAAPVASAAAFDAAFARLTGPRALQHAAGPTLDAEFDALRRLLPAGDARRQLLFDSLNCLRSDQDDPVLALALSDSALARAEVANDAATAARARLCRATVLQETATEPEVIAELDRAIALIEPQQEPVLMTELLTMRADSRSFVGEHAEAVRDYQRARSGLRLAGLDADPVPLLAGMAAAYRRLGDLTRARTYINEALAIDRAGGDVENEANDLIELGYVNEEAGDVEAARAAFQRSLELATVHALDWTGLYARLGLAEVLVALGRGQAALTMLDAAEAGFHSAGVSALDDALFRIRGRARAVLGQHVAALADYRRAERLLQENGNTRYLAEVMKHMAASLEARGETAAALAAQRRYGELALELGRQRQRQQNQLYEYEYEFQRSEHENRRLRAEATARQAELEALQSARRWQWTALALGGVLLVALGTLAWLLALRSRRHRAESRRDPLTGVANRRGFDTVFERALARAEVHAAAPVTTLPEAAANRETDAGLGAGALALLLLDLDHFKAINDRHGHAFGDRVLRATTAAWSALLRPSDRLGRLGGEEFAILCPETDPEAAVAIAERLRRAVRALRFDDIDPAVGVSVSIGVATYRPGDQRDTLLARADAALYRAKQAGRDRVALTAADGESPPVDFSAAARRRTPAEP